MISAILVEDDRDIATAVVEYLQLESIDCDYASNGASALELIRAQNYHVVILDINLPRMSGYTVSKTLREEGSDVPILMLTARDTLDDKLTGFSSGTDDYLVKPFAMDELVARVKALAGRRSTRSFRLQVGDLQLNVSERRATRDGELLDLAPKSLALLEVLMRASPDPVSRKELTESVWGDDEPESNSMNVHMHSLRKNVDLPGMPKLLQTVAGYGYAIKEGE